MRDPRWTVVAFLSCLTAVSLGLTGEISRAALLIPVAALVGQWRQRRGMRPGLALKVGAQVLAVFAFVFLFWRLSRFDLLGGPVALMLPAQAYYLMLPRTHRLLGRLQLMSLFQLIALAATTTKIFFAMSLVAYLALAPVAFTLAALEAGQVPRRPLPIPRGLLKAGLRAAAAALVLGVGIFLLLPRYEAGFGRMLGARDERLSGFAGEVQLGDIGRILQSDAIVMRVKVDGPLDGTVRWRGLALDEFTGTGWRLSRHGKRTVRARGNVLLLQREVEGTPVVRQDFVLEPSKIRVVFALPNALRVSTKTFRELEVDAFGGMERWFPARSRIEYSVWSAPAAPPATEEQARTLERCLQLPELDPRVEALAQGIVEGIEDPAARAEALESYLRSTHDYTLDVQDVGRTDPVGSFLLERRAGHCEYFASGMAVMARSLGMPTRIVTGYQAGSWSRLGRAFIVRQRDAHSWVEVWLPGRGWTGYDPTPFVERIPESTGLGTLKELWRSVQIFWDDNVVGFNFNHQASALITFGDWRDAAMQALRGPGAGRLLVAITVTALAGAALLAWRRGASAPGRPTRAFYRRALTLLRRRGLPLREGQTPAELAAEAARCGGPAGEAAVELTRLYYEARFGGREPDEARVRELLRQLEDLPDLRKSA
jgi:transglutaminase-like putative cysteine protease